MPPQVLQSESFGHITYKSNVSNSLAEKTYRLYGANIIEKAFEIEHRENAELMRMKYCIRYELGICPRHHKGQKTHNKLFLVNNGRSFPLLFDCEKCEMAVLSPIQESQK